MDGVVDGGVRRRVGWRGCFGGEVGDGGGGDGGGGSGMSGSGGGESRGGADCRDVQVDVRPAELLVLLHGVWRSCTSRSALQAR